MSKHNKPTKNANSSQNQNRPAAGTDKDKDFQRKAGAKGTSVPNKGQNFDEEQTGNAPANKGYQATGRFQNQPHEEDEADRVGNRVQGRWDADKNLASSDKNQANRNFSAGGKDIPAKEKDRTANKNEPAKR